jgi:hypothetical protein
MTKRFLRVVLAGGLVLALFLGGCDNPADGDDSPSVQQLAADEFRAVWGLVLEIKPERVSLSDEADVDDALETWEALDEEEKAELAAEKAALDSLKARINTLKSSTAVLRVYLEGKPDNTVYNPYPVAYMGRETPVAIYNAIGAGGKYVALDLSASSVTGFEYDLEEGRKFVVELTLPDSLEEIEDHAATSPSFGGFPNLKSLRAPNLVTVGQYAFYGCTGLETVSLDNAVSIGQSAFQGCTSLKTVSLDKAVNIGYYAFAGCTSLKSATLDKAVDIGYEMFYQCTSLETASMGAATSVGNYVFYGCTSLKTITLDAVTSVGIHAFELCTSLETISLNEATEIGEWAFFQCTILSTVNLPKAVSIGNYTFRACDLTTVNLLKVETIGDLAFNACDGLIAITLPEAASIGSQAFSGCTSLTTVTLPKAVSIGASAFQLCTSLSTVTLGEMPPTAIGTRIFASAATEPKTITIKVPNVGAYTGAGSPWTDKVNMTNSTAGYYWDNTTATRDNLTVALAAITG